MENNDRRWFAVCLGYSRGSIVLSSQREIKLSHEPVKIAFSELKAGFELRGELGKLADTQDCFLFCFTEIDPEKENFDLEAVFTVPEQEMGPEHCPTNQTGYGLAAADTVCGRASEHMFRNYLLAGRSRLVCGMHCAGARVTGGYTEPEIDQHSAAAMAKRIVDPTRAFSHQKPEDTIAPGDTDTFRLSKTDSGFTVSQNGGEEGDRFDIPGCDFLTAQEKGSIYVGFLLGGAIRLAVSSITFEVRPGKFSTTPEGTFQNVIPDYPFRPEQMAAYRNFEEVIPTEKAEDGSLVIPCGRYAPETPLILRGIGKDKEAPVVIRAQRDGEVILDGCGCRSPLPLLLVSGNGFELRGIVFQNAPSCGVMISGSGNTLINCTASGNKDTGILICSLPGTEKAQWPAGNKIIGCVSHDNCDSAFFNADGFGAKLRVGSGNVFENCTAHHNIDDGFDFYTKTCFGPIGEVTLKDCTAYENGALSDGSAQRRDYGSGFKLGGEYISVKHRTSGCRAYGNCGKDIDLNHNPDADTSGIACSRKILFLIPAVGGGGAERVTVNLANQLCRKYRVTVFCFTKRKNPYPVDARVKLIEPGNPARQRSKTRNTIVRIIKYLKIGLLLTAAYLLRKMPGYIRSVAKLKEKEHFDVVVSMLSLPNDINARVPGGFHIMSERNDPSCEPRRVFRKSVKSLQEADLVIFQTAAVQSMYPESIRKKSVVIRNPVSVGAVPFRPDSRKIVTAGRLESQKNQAMLIRAFAEFSASHPDYTLHIYGEGRLRRKLERQIGRLGLSGKVFLEGFIPDLHDRMADARMFVLSSDYEGLPNALMEAMMMGLPVITTGCNGSSELVSDGETGLVVPVGDAAKMAQAMAKMADDEELSVRVSENAKVRAEDFRTEKIMGEWERAFFKDGLS